MRIPIRKIYRAFPELDEFSDEQCERFMRRIEVSGVSKTTPGLAFLVVGGIGLLFGCVISAGIHSGIEDRYRNSALWFVTLLSAAPVFVTTLLPVLIGFVARDLLLRRQFKQVINEKLERIRCLDCRYVLIGQVPRDDLVTCSECGRVHQLRELGIVAEDLIPPAMDDPAGHAYV